jgi:hypothetical protein
MGQIYVTSFRNLICDLFFVALTYLKEKRKMCLFHFPRSNINGIILFCRSTFERFERYQSTDKSIRQFFDGFYSMAVKGKWIEWHSNKFLSEKKVFKYVRQKQSFD